MRRASYTAVLAALAIAGCGSPAAHHHASASSEPAALTNAQGATICTELNSWAQTANNQDQPRLSTQLAKAGTAAAGTELGSDLVSFGDDLQTSNSLALEPGPPGDEQPVQMVEADCKTYGVTFNP